MKLYIKYMVSNRCKIMVDFIKGMGLHFIMVNLGEVEIMENLSPVQLQILKQELSDIGLELMDDKKSVLIERVKSLIIDMVHNSEEMIKTNVSDYLSKKLEHHYTYISNLFSEVQGTTIEHFIIAHKVERIKELIMYGELNLTEISYKMNYSSVAHLSNQFKRVHGFSPSHYKQLKDKRRNALEEVGVEEDAN